MALNVTFLFLWEADSRLEQQQQKMPSRRTLAMFSGQQSFHRRTDDEAGHI